MQNKPNPQMLYADWSERIPQEEAKRIRVSVFVDEQQFAAENEFDKIDAAAWHLVLYSDNFPVAVARIYPTEEDGAWSIGRVAVSKECRGCGFGAFAVTEAEKQIVKLGGRKAVLSAQCRVQEFYEKLSYVPSGEIYLDEYCPHIHMEKELSL